MTAHRIANVCLFVLACVVWAFAMDATYRDDLDSAADQERREWMAAIAHCHRAFGPATQPEYNDRGQLVCIGKRGQKHIEVAIK